MDGIIGDTILTTLPIPALIFVGGRCKQSNPAAITLLCKTAEHIIGKEITAIIPDFPTEVSMEKPAELTSVPYMPTTETGNSLLFLHMKVRPIDKNTFILYIVGSAEKSIAQANVVSLELTERIIFEMRKAVNGIVGSTVLLSDTRLTREQSDSIKCIHDSQISMIMVINDVSDYIKLKTNRMSIEPKTFSISGFVDDCVRQINDYANIKKIPLHIKIGHGVPNQICTDPTMLRKMIVKCLQNAIDFSGEASPVDLTISKNGNHAIGIKIVDRGCGMTEDIRRRIFVESDFSQSEGLGLSLILCKLMAIKLGGDIIYETAANVGTTFYIKIPMVKRHISGIKHFKDRRVMIVTDIDSDAKIIRDILIECRARPIIIATASDADAILASGFHVDAIIIKGSDHIAAATNIPVIEIVDGDITARGTSRLLLKRPIDKSKVIEVCRNVIVEDKRFLRKTNINILVVDDSPTSRIVVVKQLNRLGYTNVDTAVDGADAITKIVHDSKPELDSGRVKTSGKKYNVIFLDLVMPKMTGLEVMASLVEKFGTENCPYVIAMTANELSIDKTKCIRAGMKDFIAKPVTPESLNKVLQNI